MIVFHQVAAAVVLLVLTLWLQCAGVAALIEWLRRVAARDIYRLGSVRSAALVVQSTVAIIILFGDSSMGELLPDALFSVMGNCVLLLGDELLDSRIWRCGAPVPMATFRAAGKHDRRPHVGSIGLPVIRTSHSAH